MQSYMSYVSELDRNRPDSIGDTDRILAHYSITGGVCDIFVESHSTRYL